MILADTSARVGHLRESEPRLQELLLEGEVLVHPFVIGELACGNLRHRAAVLSLLRELPMGAVAGETRDRSLRAAATRLKVHWPAAPKS